MKLETLFAQAQRLSFRKGHLLLYPDDLSKDVYFIESGHVRVYSLTQWGDEKLYMIYKPGELFPLLWLFDSRPIRRFYEALDELVVRKLSREECLHAVNTDSEILHDIMNIVSGTIEVLVNRIDSLEFTNAYARLISRLMYLARRFGEKRGHKIIITVPLSHKDIASSIALTRETTSREFEKLEKKGLVEYVRHFIVINDMQKLEKEISLHFDTRLI